MARTPRLPAPLDEPDAVSQDALVSTCLAHLNALGLMAPGLERQRDRIANRFTALVGREAVAHRLPVSAAAHRVLKRLCED